MKYAVFISSIALTEENGIDPTITTEELVQEAQDRVGDLWAQDGPPDPWIMDEEILERIEMLLPGEKHAEDPGELDRRQERGPCAPSPGARATAEGGS